MPLACGGFFERDSNSDNHRKINHNITKSDRGSSARNGLADCKEERDYIPAKGTRTLVLFKGLEHTSQQRALSVRLSGPVKTAVMSVSQPSPSTQSKDFACQERTGSVDVDRTGADDENGLHSEDDFDAMVVLTFSDPVEISVQLSEGFDVKLGSVGAARKRNGGFGM
ncbi:hypothetical protein ARMSODRAFT_980033 [Armillaria solidipes]|uniref:Uncharacterized protein n=1 Tax=Armillaria solidipes TaxID=1076256 RepID=A0A2H3B0Y1_9AGAR|nr:hypothetical protein ARMSODRAFT_980033 [Armillaria solidipes]